MKYLMTVALAAFVLSVLSSCSSTYVPTREAYQEELHTILGKHEDNALVNYGKPNEIMELAEGWKALVYTRLPYSVSPITKTKHYLGCKTTFVVSPSSRIEKIRADGNYCVR